MTNYTFTSQAQLTEFLEYAPLSKANPNAVYMINGGVAYALGAQLPNSSNGTVGNAGNIYVLSANGNNLVYDPQPVSVSKDASGDVILTTTLESGGAETITVNATGTADTIIADGITTTLNNLDYLSFTSTGMDYDEESTTPGYDEVTVSSVVSGASMTDQINTTMASDYTVDTLKFEGQPIAGAFKTGQVDQYGRTYSLDGTTLTITKGSDSLTINDFHEGDFGIDITSPYSYSKVSVPGSVDTHPYAMNDSGEIGIANDNFKPILRRSA